MPDRLHQLHVEYAPAEDRVLLKINTTDKRELRLWLTRRVVTDFWNMLPALLEGRGGAKAQSDPELRKAQIGFDREKAMRSGSTTTPFAADAREFPLGAAPVVLSGVGYKPPAARGGLGRLDLRTAAGAEIGIPAADHVLHSLATMLASVNRHTGWDLELEIGYPIGEKPLRRSRVH